MEAKGALYDIDEGKIAQRGIGVMTGGQNAMGGRRRLGVGTGRKAM